MSNYKRARKYLENACFGILHDILNECNFSEDEKLLFENKYIKKKLKENLCEFVLFVRNNAYHKRLNKVLAKVEFWLHSKENKI